LGLVDNLVSGCQRIVRINVPSKQAAFLEKLTEQGFKHQYTLPVMAKDGKALPGRRELIFGLVSLGAG
jgi:hypothetical protein